VVIRWVDGRQIIVLFHLRVTDLYNECRIPDVHVEWEPGSLLAV